MILEFTNFNWNLTTFPYPIDSCSVEEVQCGSVFSDFELTKRQITDVLIEAKRLLMPGCSIYITIAPWDWLEQTLRTLGFEDITISSYATSAMRPRAI